VKCDGENMTRGETMQPRQSVKLRYQSCSRTRATWTYSRLDGSLVYGWVVSLGKGMGVSVGSLDGIQVWCSDGIRVLVEVVFY